MDFGDFYKLQTPYDRLKESGKSEWSFLILESLLKEWFNDGNKPVPLNVLKSSMPIDYKIRFWTSLVDLVSNDYAKTSGNLGTSGYVTPTTRGVMFYEEIYAVNAGKVDWKHKELRPLSEF